jgi:hypothetical protein
MLDASNPHVDKAKMMGVLGVLRGQAEDGMPLEYLCGTLEGLVAMGFCSKDKRPPLSAEERAERSEKAEDRERRITQARGWLTGQEPPSYIANDRGTCRSVIEIIEAMGVPREDRRAYPRLLHGILTDGSTGWGLVAETDGLKLYAASARLLQYESKPGERKAA